MRRDWELVLSHEFSQHSSGELGWSAEWRKHKLTASEVRSRGRAWRLYACESFCDTAAWRFSGLEAHDEFTLARTFRRIRREWFARSIESGPVLI